MVPTKKQVLIGREMREGGFKEGFHSLPHKLLTDARAEICRLCYWNLNSFNGRLNGKRPFRIYEIEQIEKFFESHNINAWTGELIKK
jgi:hypothetical protein